MTSFALKIIAIISMTANHAAHIFYPYLPYEAYFVMILVGGITFPTMAFLLVEGYHHTSNVRKYGIRLLIFALIAQIPYMLFIDVEGNVLWTLLIGLIVLYLYDHMKNRALYWLICIALILVSYLCDWGIIGVLMVLIIRLVPNRRTGIIYAVLLVMLANGLPNLITTLSTGNIWYLPNALYSFIGCTAAAVMLCCYNGKRGRPLKYFFYVYYPAHILVLGIIKVLLFGMS